MAEWISVKDRLPDDIRDVIVFIPNGFGFIVAVSWFNRDDGFKRWMHSGLSKKTMSKVTHWMPLPEPPKEDE